MISDVLQNRDIVNGKSKSYYNLLFTILKKNGYANMTITELAKQTGLNYNKFSRITDYGTGQCALKSIDTLYICLLYVYDYADCVVLLSYAGFSMYSKRKKEKEMAYKYQEILLEFCNLKTKSIEERCFLIMEKWDKIGLPALNL